MEFLDSAEEPTLPHVVSEGPTWRQDDADVAGDRVRLRSGGRLPEDRPPRTEARAQPVRQATAVASRVAADGVAAVAVVRARLLATDSPREPTYEGAPEVAPQRAAQGASESLDDAALSATKGRGGQA